MRTVPLLVSGDCGLGVALPFSGGDEGQGGAASPAGSTPWLIGLIWEPESAIGCCDDSLLPAIAIEVATCLS